MIFRRPQRFRQVGPDRVRLQLSDQDRTILASLLPQLRHLLTGDDPATVRLFPTAYADDPERDAGYHALVRDELIEKRFAAIDLVEATIDGDELSFEELNGWMHAVNDLRLVLGTILDVSEDMDIPEPDDPKLQAYAVYEFLGILLHEVIQVMRATLD